MTTAVALGTPLAEALSSAIPPKLAEMGWSTGGGEDSALTEYIILMLVNGKTQDQISSELSNDLLGLGEGDTQALEFSRWLFEQVETLDRQFNGGGSSEQQSAQAIPSFNDQETAGAQSGGPNAGMEEDTQMGDTSSQVESVPTGPKAMRNGRQGGRGRMIGQINKTLDRGNDSMLHRVRGSSGSGRINGHGRDQHKGSRSFQNGRGMGGRQMGGMGMGMPGGPMPGGSAAANVMQMTPENQMQLMALLEEQARMMAQLMPGMVPPAINPAFQQGGRPQQGRSLFERIERQPHQNGNFAKRGQRHGNRGQDATSTDVDMDTNPDNASKANEQGEASTDSVCHWNLRCTKKDCPFAHQSPAAPEGTPIDVTDRCPYGAACKNKKCTGRHPSPAVKSSHQADEPCRFFPHCTNPNCPFKHPSMPLCRNGADCTAEGCKFTHLQTACKFNPCLNPNCPYKHAEGQKGSFADKVWTADSAQKKEHVSERKFVDENAEEELIKPGTSGADGSHNQEVMT
ncbi:oxygen-dependent protoporphyrinogen oxidase [Paecilomyces lecythidis]